MFNNGPKLVTQGLDLLVDAADRQSYPGSGTVWTDLRSGTTGSLTGSVSYTSEFYGGLTFSNSSSAVIFPSITANYGTGSFTVEMAFKPTFINGRHYLMSKNSGSFPNWAIYLSGSSGQGKLWSEFRINASVSCSVSSSTTFVTGSVYQVDVVLAPGVSASGIYVNGSTEGGILGNGAGSLTNTGSLFVGNYFQDNNQNFSGSIYTIKSYTVQSLAQPPINYNSITPRLGKSRINYTLPTFDLLIVAGGGAGGRGAGGQGGGGGGAGGLRYITNYTLPASSTVVVGQGGLSSELNGSDSKLGDITVFGGGGGGGSTIAFSGKNGGSGGGGHSNLAPGGLGTTGQGNDGGPGLGEFFGGGGGGSFEPGDTNPSRGWGGSGSYIPAFEAIGGFPAGAFAGGGEGGVSQRSVTYGGGGRGGDGGGAAAAGRVNTGGGGGGGYNNGFGGAGGSGIVAIRYSGTPMALGGEITQSAGFTYHVFRTVGTSSFTIF
jgi:hypothetical protein